MQTVFENAVETRFENAVETNSLCCHHQNILKSCLTTISVFRWNNCGFSKCVPLLPSANSNLKKKPGCRTFPSPRVSFGELSPPKLKHEPLYISGVFVNFYNVKPPPPAETLATVLMQNWVNNTGGAAKTHAKEATVKFRGGLVSSF